MRQFLLIIFSFCVLSAGFGQITSGTKLTGNIKTKDINDKDVDIFADLDAGKTVIIDVFATWCGPCWSFHRAGILKELHTKYGPNGADKVRIYGIEADSRTPLSHLFQQVAASGNVPSSLGNWVEGVEYQIINSHSFNSLLKITAFPTLYIIRPDRTVLDAFPIAYQLPMWEKIITTQAQKDAVFNSGISERTFCTSTTFNVKMLNIGHSNITTTVLTIKKNGVSKDIEINNPVKVFEEITVNHPEFKAEETTNIEITIKTLDGEPDDDDVRSKVTGTQYKPLVTENKMVIKVTTDFYPGETSWSLMDNKNRTLRTDSYKPGNADQYGGGGADANKTFTYNIDIANVDINCLRFILRDSYGDGMDAFSTTQGHPVPGVEFFTSDGTMLKPKLLTDILFSSSSPNTPASNTIFAAADITSGLADQDFVESLSVYPNPANDILNINLKIADGKEYEMFITDIMGAVVSKISNHTNFINISHLNAGLYFLNVKTKEGLFAHRFSKI
ncbi:MAG: T9SS type A sorting domain-containing protein [Saprospiraceae bacterium]|nr:T9SS type A sorting domain-containing protein [Saprospiraceae bacterium]